LYLIVATSVYQYGWHVHWSAECVHSFAEKSKVRSANCVVPCEVVYAIDNRLHN